MNRGRLITATAAAIAIPALGLGVGALTSAAQAASRAPASATGVQEENDCVPDCAAGRFRGYPVDVVFWGTGNVPGQPGRQRYTEVTLLYPGARPAHQAATFSVPLP